jgi:hypothetical protein
VAKPELRVGNDNPRRPRAWQPEEAWARAGEERLDRGDGNQIRGVPRCGFY